MYLESEWAARWWAGDCKAHGHVYNAELPTFSAGTGPGIGSSLARIHGPEPRTLLDHRQAFTCRLPQEAQPSTEVERVGYWHDEIRAGRTRLTTD